MKVIKLILSNFFILFISFSCKQNESRVKDKIDVLEVSTEAKKQAEVVSKGLDKDCKQNFDEFLSVFGKDSIFQKRKIKFPLIKKYTYLNDNNKDTTEVESIAYKDYRFVNFSEDKNAWKKTSDAYKVEIEKLNDSAFYKLRGIDNGIYEDWLFVRENDCWYLKAIDNYSN